MCLSCHASRITIGRAPSNNVVVTDYHLSGEHAQIVREGEGYVFRDLRSTNGSAVERVGVKKPVDATRRHDEPVLPEATEALHRAVSSTRVLMRVPRVGGTLDHPSSGMSNHFQLISPPGPGPGRSR